MELYLAGLQLQNMKSDTGDHVKNTPYQHINADENLFQFYW